MTREIPFVRKFAIGIAAFSIAAVMLCRPAVVWAEETEKKADTAGTDASPQIEGVDIPTADVLDASTFATTFRFYNQGGIDSRLIIGPLRRVNLGITFDAQHIVGSMDPHMVRPSVYFKLRAFDGNDYLPALALGYDNMAYLWQDSTHEFLQKERGLYLVGTHEMFVPDFDVHAGMNINDFDNTKIYGFAGATYKIVSAFALMVEYDNIRNGPDNRLNIGGRYWVAPYFNIDLAARNVGRDGDRGAERIVRLNYVAHFPF